MKNIKIGFLLGVILFLGFNTNVNAANLKMTCPQTTINVGSSMNCNASGITGTRKWTSSKANVATVTTNGIVTGKKAGVTIIKVKVGKKVVKRKIKVKKVKSSFTVSGNSSIAKGSSETYSVSNLVGASTCTWSLSNTKARFKLGTNRYQSSYKGTYVDVYGSKKGTSTIKIKCGTTTKKKTIKILKLKKTTETITTKDSNSALEVKVNSLEVYHGQTFTAKVNTGSNCTWSSDAFFKENVSGRTATFSASKKGSGTISATCKINGQTFTGSTSVNVLSASNKVKPVRSVDNIMADGAFFEKGKCPNGQTSNGRGQSLKYRTPGTKEIIFRNVYFKHPTIEYLDAYDSLSLSINGGFKTSGTDISKNCENGNCTIYYVVCIPDIKYNRSMNILIRDKYTGAESAPYTIRVAER